MTVVEKKIKGDENYHILRENLQTLKTMKLLSGKQLNIVELPMPDAVIYEGLRLPASYAQFLHCQFGSDGAGRTVPKNDEKALDILQQCFPDRKVVGIDSTDIIWGLGSFHCI